MLRFIAGVGSALLLVLAGMLSGMVLAVFAGMVHR